VVWLLAEHNLNNYHGNETRNSGFFYDDTNAFPLSSLHLDVEALATPGRVHCYYMSKTELVVFFPSGVFPLA
jgi:hypothetical protein